MDLEQSSSSFTKDLRSSQRKTFLLRTMIQWHWISSAICLVGMLMFAITGITLNHAGQIVAEPTILTLQAELPAELIEKLKAVREEESAPLPVDVSTWLSQQFPKSIGARPATWSEDEVYLSMPGPGVDAWMSIDRETGKVEFESTQRGWISYLNDLHKGRNTGAGWKLFIDLFAVATLVFCLTGLFLLYFYARQRKMTWPLVGLGLVLPVLLALLLIH
ncbi:PepSY-associated TM helix domain-containing protein [Lacunimicrobium album]